MSLQRFETEAVTTTEIQQSSFNTADLYQQEDFFKSCFKSTPTSASAEAILGDFEIVMPASEKPREVAQNNLTDVDRNAVAIIEEELRNSVSPERARRSVEQVLQQCGGNRSAVLQQLESDTSSAKSDIPWTIKVDSNAPGGYRVMRKGVQA